MKTKISAAIVLLFLMACGSETKNQQVIDNSTTTAPGASAKFIIKAANMQYISLGPNHVLIANQPDPTKALVFEKIDMGNGKNNLKAATGMFVSDDRSKNDSVFADKPKASDWETFEIIAVDQTRINIKSSTGKYLKADLSINGVIVSQSDKTAAWELFEIEKN